MKGPHGTEKGPNDSERSHIGAKGPQMWRRGVAVECRIRDQEVAGSSLGRALRRKNSGQVSHTYVPLSPSSITWYWPNGGDARRLGR